MSNDKHILAKQVGRRIKELREARKIKQYQLAELINMEPTNLSKLEKGAYFPREDKLKNIAKVLNVEIKEFYEINHIISRDELLQEINNITNHSNDKELMFFYKILKSYKELNLT